MQPDQSDPSAYAYEILKHIINRPEPQRVRHWLVAWHSTGIFCSVPQQALYSAYQRTFARNNASVALMSASEFNHTVLKTFSGADLQAALGSPTTMVFTGVRLRHNAAWLRESIRVGEELPLDSVVPVNRTPAESASNLLGSEIDHAANEHRIPVLSHADIKALIAYAEVERSTRWLHACFYPDDASSIPQQAMWHAYKTTFAAYTSGGTSQLSFKAFMDSLTIAFPKVSTQLMPGSPAYVIMKGICARQSVFVLGSFSNVGSIDHNDKPHTPMSSDEAELSTTSKFDLPSAGNDASNTQLPSNHTSALVKVSNSNKDEVTGADKIMPSLLPPAHVTRTNSSLSSGFSTPESQNSSQGTDTLSAASKAPEVATTKSFNSAHDTAKPKPSKLEISEKDSEQQPMVRLQKVDMNSDSDDIVLPDFICHNDDKATLELVDQAKSVPFSAAFIAFLIRDGALTLIPTYLHKFPFIRGTLEDYLIDGEWPLIFFAIERNDTTILRFLMEYVDIKKWVNGVSKRGIPALAYAILLGLQAHVNTLDVVKLLLAAGAEPTSIPKELWLDYMARPQVSKRANDSTHWCTPTLWAKMSEGLTLSQKYFLCKAHLQTRPTDRAIHADTLLGISALRELPYWLVGQDQASKFAVLNVFSHIVHGETKPLAMVFAGSSGHGKTELAEHLGRLLKVETLIVDCGQIKNAWGLLGSEAGYVGSKAGSRLNNYLAKRSGTRSVVFLDEIDKTVKEVWDALLVLFASGRYSDRRNNKDIDCSKTIFIMATNQGDNIIEEAWKKHTAKKTPFDVDAAQELLQANFITKFGAPFTGRLRCIVPFLPFNTGEQAVIANGFVLKVIDSLRKPVDIDRKHLVAHGHLIVEKDEELCKHIAEKSYNVQLGARNIENAVIQRVRLPLDELWRSESDVVKDEDNHGAIATYMVGLVPVPAGENNEKKVLVRRAGVTALPFREALRFPRTVAEKKNDEEVRKDDEEESVASDDEVA